MKDLRMNPQIFDIELCLLSKQKETKNDYGTAHVLGQFGTTKWETTFLSTEMEQIGNWFLKLAKEVKKK